MLERLLGLLVAIGMTIVFAMIVLATMPERAHAIEIAAVVTQPQLTIIGYEKVTKRKWTWHGRSKRYSYVPIYGYAQTSPVPEPQSWQMLLSGMLMVAYVVKRKSRHK